MTKYPNRPYNLEERTLVYSRAIINLAKKFSKDLVNIRLIGQLVDAVGSVGANYREANEALSKKDFIHRMKVIRKECKESTYWLELLREANPNSKDEIDFFIKESKELRSIFSSIIEKVV